MGIDVGGTSLKGVLVDGAGRVLSEGRAPTPPSDASGASVVEAACALAERLAGGAKLPIGVVVPGIVDDARGVVVHAANLGWSDLPLRALLERRLGRRVAFGHDVRAGGIAEARWGAAAGSSGVLAFVAIGTGIAAAILVEGRPIVSGGWAGEIGQLPITTGPHAGERTERIASASAIARRADCGNALEVAARVAVGDPLATAVWAEAVSVLADLFAALTATVAPGEIVVGGGLARSGGLLLEPLAALLLERVGILRQPILRCATLDDRAAAFGAASLAMGRAGAKGVQKREPYRTV